MARRSKEAIEKGKRETCSLDVSLHRAANDFGVEALALLCGKNRSSLTNNLDPEQPARRVTLDQFETICCETRDVRILDAIHTLFPGTAWFEMMDSGVGELDLLRHFSELSKKTSVVVDGLIEALSNDGVIDDTEWPELDFDLRRFLGAAHALLYFAQEKYQQGKKGKV